ncbi:lipoxygenase homology domain-containing protein 1-like isoform X2 [Dendronephthya gigantea]|uniref:lipoxygenase homology domain-containing protein 1-like isoform X2 n=1 Tax=Dendronephthya gigantea TaxID=151771 RepID=UPI00106AADFD|nr:lipoxygenase homology domain-containing protein 1-like isoform X2 [Dendronephthya gigantea]
MTQIFSLIWLILLVAFSEAVQYTIIVETGTSPGAGTDCTVEITLYGLLRMTGNHAATSQLKLEKSQNHRNKFEKGKTDTFIGLQDPKDLININKIEVRTSGFSLGPEWQLKKVTIMTGKGEKYEFAINNWLKKTDASYLFFSAPSKNIQPVAPVTIWKVTYTVKVKTGVMKYADTNSKVYIKIYGLSRKTKQPKAITPTQLTGAVAGDVISRASVNTFTIEDEEDLTTLSKIGVVRDSRGDDWYLEDISVTTQNGEEFVFPANRWITNVNQYFMFDVTTYTQYTVIVETGTSAGAGTDCNVEITLYGMLRKTGLNAATNRLKLEKSENHANKFEMGKTDTFKNLQDPKDLININKIEVRTSGFSLGPEWQLKKVTVMTGKGEKYEFIGDFWLKTDMNYLIFSVPSTNVLPLAPVTVPKAKYTVIVRTGNMQRAGTNSKVYIKMYGLSKETKQPKSITPTQLTGAVVGDAFLRGSVNTFTIEDEEDLTTLSEIEVLRDNTGNDWYLEEITVITQNGERYVFSAKSWINVVNQYFLFKVITYTQYTVVVETGTSLGAGTDCNVDITLYGMLRKSGLRAATNRLKLEKSENHVNKFEMGKTDTFKNLRATNDLINIDQIEITMSGFSFGVPWLLKRITIVAGRGEKYEFIGNFWLKKTGVSYSITSRPSTYIRPVETVTITKVKYTVIVKTGDVKYAETNSKVYIKIFGLSRKTKQPKAITPTQLTGAVAGDVISRASINQFTIEDEEDLTTLSRIAVIREKGNDWYLEEITVVTYDGEKYVFPAKKWINHRNEYFVFKVTIAPSPAPTAPPTPQPPSPTPAKTGVEYSIIAYTDSVAKAGTRAKVYMTFVGALATSSEIHLKSSTLETRVQRRGSKIFQVKIPDVGPIRIIRVRQDVSSASPNWNINKVLVIHEHLTVYEFILGSWLAVTALERSLTDSYPATSMKFKGYSPCVQPTESKLHPNLGSNVVLLQPCSRLQNLFKLQPDGVIQHLTSGMCIQGMKNGDPLNTATGDRVTLNNPCTLYRPGYNTPHALQFKFTSGGSLMEVKSGKCISITKGQENVPLTFTSTCDTADTIIDFIDKTNKVIKPESTGKSPTGKSPSRAPPATPGAPSSPGAPSTPAPPATPGTSSTQTPNTQTVPGGTMPNNYGSPVYCQSTCGQPSCASTCQPACCNSPQQTGIVPAGFPPIVRCPSYCSPGQCRSVCPVGCCFPNWDSQHFADEDNTIEIIDRQR